MTVGAVLVPAIHVLAYRGTGGVSAGLGRVNDEKQKSRGEPRAFALRCKEG